MILIWSGIKRLAEPGTEELTQRLYKGQEPHHTTEWPDDKKEKNEDNKNKPKKD